METALSALVESARAGDDRAFEAIMARFRDNAHSRAYAMVGDYHLAQDVVQEAFTEAHLCLHKLRDPAAFPGWFKRIVIKRGDRLIRGKRLPTTVLDEARDVAAISEDTDFRLDCSELADSVDQALAFLPDHERDVAREYYSEGESQKAIAARLEVPVTTIKKRLYASRQRLKRRLADLAHRNDSEPDGERFSVLAQLYSAAWNGFAEKTRALLRRDPQLLYTVDEDGLSILQYAAHAAHVSGNDRVSRLLLALGAPVDAQTAAALGMNDLLAELVSKPGSNIDRVGAWRRRPLHWAASGGHTALVEWLLDRGADSNARDRWGCTPLHLAVELGRTDTARILLERGADWRATLKNGKTALHLAAQKGDHELVRELLRKGAAVDVFAAAGLGWRDHLAHLLRRDSTAVHARLPFGATPLHVAAESAQVETAKFLVDEGARLDVVCAAELGWTDRVVDMLRTSPKLINAKGGSFGFTPLHSASSKGRRDLARLLLAGGAEINATDDMYQKTPLAEALFYGNESMARLLYAFGGTA